ncbi:MAG: C_GCAxxG_C_C family protein [Candidatus Delongbacteria bacterium]|nr:C_GCAxxG_C_C family protein [Candidatus Delongbacteria bacterium]
MDERTIREMVVKNYEQGFHCAESILNTICELNSKDPAPFTRVVSGLRGGVGKCRQDICGALSGGAVVLGVLYGRDQGGENIDRMVEMTAEFRQRFIREFTTTVCQKVIENWQARPEYQSCRDVTAKASQILQNLIEENYIKS